MQLISIPKTQVMTEIFENGTSILCLNAHNRNRIRDIKKINTDELKIEELKTLLSQDDTYFFKSQEVDT